MAIASFEEQWTPDCRPSYEKPIRKIVAQNTLKRYAQYLADRMELNNPDCPPDMPVRLGHHLDELHYHFCELFDIPIERLSPFNPAYVVAVTLKSIWDNLPACGNIRKTVEDGKCVLSEEVVVDLAPMLNPEHTKPRERVILHQYSSFCRWWILPFSVRKLSNDIFRMGYELLQRVISIAEGSESEINRDALSCISPRILKIVERTPEIVPIPLFRLERIRDAEALEARSGKKRRVFSFVKGDQDKQELSDTPVPPSTETDEPEPVAEQPDVSEAFHHDADKRVKSGSVLKLRTPDENERHAMLVAELSGIISEPHMNEEIENKRLGVIKLLDLARKIRMGCLIMKRQGMQQSLKESYAGTQCNTSGQLKRRIEEYNKRSTSAPVPCSVFFKDGKTVFYRFEDARAFMIDFCDQHGCDDTGVIAYAEKCKYTITLETLIRHKALTLKKMISREKRRQYLADLEHSSRRR